MVMENNKTKCLGKGKGRRYPEMSAKATDFLHSYYSKPNLALSKLLSKLGQTIPAWLEDDLRDFKWSFELKWSIWGVELIPRLIRWGVQ